MKIERTDAGWVVRVPAAVVEALGMADGTRVTLRPVPREEDELRYFMADMRDRLPDFPFDREDWNGCDVEPTGGDPNAAGFTWSTRDVTYPPR